MTNKELLALYQEVLEEGRGEPTLRGKTFIRIMFSPNKHKLEGIGVVNISGYSISISHNKKEIYRLRFSKQLKDEVLDLI